MFHLTNNEALYKRIYCAPIIQNAVCRKLKSVDDLVEWISLSLRENHIWSIAQHSTQIHVNCSFYELQKIWCKLIQNIPMTIALSWKFDVPAEILDMNIFSCFF